MKVVVTGGHLSPALSIIQKLRQNKIEVVFIGRRHTFDKDKSESFEYQAIKNLNIPTFIINTGRLKRHYIHASITSLIKIVRGISQARKILNSEQPDVVLTFGGYVALPIALAARLQKIPIVTHEQTQEAGISNKIVARFAEKVFTTFDSSEKYFPKEKIEKVGLPFRDDIFNQQKKINIPTRPLIYITGGSTGSHFINKMTLSTLEDLIQLGTILLQSGHTSLTNDYDALREKRLTLKREEQKKFILKKFIYPDEIGYILNNSDITVSRSGINTVMELICLKKVAFLIPLPGGQREEQLKNAILYQNTHLGTYKEEKDLTEKIFLDEIKSLLREKGKREKTSVKFEVKKNAADKIVEHLKKYEKKKNKK